MPQTIVNRVVQKLGRRGGRLHWAAAVLTLAGLLGVGPRGVVPRVGASVTPGAPAAGMPPKSYMNKAPFYLPVTFLEKLRPSLREVQLYVKEGPDKPWVLKDKVPPTQSWFTFRPQQDGEFWFTVVTVDQAGRSNPSNVATAPPGQIVVLDTQAPRVDVASVAPTAEGQCVHCAIRDHNPDQRKTKFFYQTADGLWRQADALPGRADAFCIPAQAQSTGMVQVVAADMAGNVSKRELNIAMVKGEPAAVSGMPAIHEEKSKTVAGTGYVEKTGYPPTIPDRARLIVEDAGPFIPGEKIMTPAPLPELQPSQPLLPPTAVPNPEARKVAVTQTKRALVAAVQQVVNNTRLMLEYQIEQMGQSGVGKVEIWLTRDHGQTWQRHGEDEDRKSPVEVNFPGEGQFGISLAVSNGRGFGAHVPQPGDTPDYCVEVDMTKPTADILSVRPETGGEGASLLIIWTARDQNPAAEPIELYYSAKAAGPWLPIAKGLKNDGQFRWLAPRDLGHAHVRLLVRDAAGNITTVDTPQAIALDDLSRPRGRVVSLTPTSTVPQGN